MKCNVCFGEIQEHSHNGEVYWSEGHNAEPLVSGRCCDYCNGLVTGFRMFGYNVHRSEDFTKTSAKFQIEKQRDLLLKIAVMQKIDREKGEEE